MTTTSKTTSPAHGAVLTALTGTDGLSAAQVAEAAGIGRSTATKALATLADQRQVTRTAGGRENGRRLPDRWSPATHAPARKDLARAPRPTGPGSRLGHGELTGQVLGYLHDHPGEHSPTAVAAGLGGRSGGAVSNALARLTERGQAVQTSDRPRRYTAAGR